MRQVKIGAALATFLALVGTGGWFAWQQEHQAKPPTSVSPQVAAGPVSTGLMAARESRPLLPLPVQATPEAETVRGLQAAYNAGRYGAVETAATQVIRQAAQQPTLPRREAAANAGNLLAYAAARRDDLKLARVRFAAAQKEAATLPDKGRQTAPPGEVAPTLEEDDAYQQAVCLGALGNKAGAEAAYLAFMRRFPDSPLVSAAMKRIGWLHGGDVPPSAQAVWRQAKQIAAQHQEAKQREASLCGPECLAELLRRQGQGAGVPGLVHALAREMNTDDRGTSLAALATAATHHGLGAQGLALTQKGLTETLAKRPLPVIALVAPGHYVLVEQASAAGVRLWDPDAGGIGRGGRRELTTAQWQQEWRGVTLAVE